ncbi:hypothetical protein CALVIDRAFT_506667 [Calocera viscosa TUFC12733]|uniref:Helicase SWR1 n=1 Tax=Calocera viscosa (strain TUFC12733) TaxID=1330018 RepID=A0A167GIL2_CALVF|nr:hypothetical protein CALVIDRAFT_506667 [Calocera viscosa TUFC12733]
MGEEGASGQAKPEDARRTGTAAHQPSLTAASSPPTKRRNSRRSQHSQAAASSSDFNATSASLAYLPIDARGPVDTRRGVLVRERSKDLRTVFHEHDSLVREAFHLENFVTMIGYDPELAKQDKSNVYQEFESEFDLTNVISSADRNVSRKKTRNRATESAELLASLASMNDSSTSKGKGRAVKEETSEALRVNEKGKGRHSSASAGTRLYRDDPSLQTAGARANGHGASHHLGGHQSERLLPSYPSSPLTPTVSSLTPTSPLMLPMKRLRPVELDPRFAKVKRIRLTVKVPPAQYTAPDQRPPRPKFRNSVDAYLESYLSIEDTPTTLSELEAAAKRDAELYDRIASLRADGRLLARPEQPVAAPKSSEPKRRLSHWDVVVSHTGVQVKRMQDDLKAKQNTARRVSRAVVAHFERIAQTEDREKQAEDKRLRALAKFTVREVMKKWREAISHVREVKLAQEKEELARQGKKQLNAILEQSTQVLEAQHMDLTRAGRSRSASTPASWADSRSGSDRETDYGSEVHEDSDDESDNEEGRHEQEDLGEESSDEASDEDVSVDGSQVDRRHRMGGVGGQRSEYAELMHDDGISAEFSLMSGGSPLQGESSRQPSIACSGNRPADAQATAQEYLDSKLSAEHQSINPARSLIVNGKSATTVLLNGMTNGDEATATPHDHVTPAKSNTNGMTLAAVVKESEPSTRTSDGEVTVGEAIHRRASVRAIHVRHSAIHTTTNNVPHDEDDPEFLMDVPDGLDEQDREMEEAMEEEEEHNGDSDEELGGLQEDADVPIEALLRQYGYAPSEEDAETENGSDTATNEGLMNRAVSTNSMGDDTGSIIHGGAMKVTSIDVGSSPRPTVLHRAIPPEPAAKAEEAEVVTSDTNSRLSGGRATVQSMDEENTTGATDDSETQSELEQFEVGSEASLVSDQLVDGRIRQPFLLRGTLRPYQHAGLEWLVSLYNNGLNGILADEMGLGKTIQTIALLAHLACDRGIWGPHLIIVPTSVLLNWEMEFKRFLPGFKILTYYGSIKERKEKRHGWNTEFHFNVCITSYQLVLADQHIFRRKQWRYMILDEAHNIKNFRSQRWQTLLGFHSQRRLLLTGTPLQNNLMELWSLLYFLMPSGLSEEFSGGTFAGQKQFAEWFSNPMDKAIGNTDGSELDEETLETVNKLHTLLRPYILRRMKSEVEKQLPAKYDHIVECRLSKRQRLLYDEFMQRASTRETLATGSFLSVVNLLMQLRKICNHPDLFEVRPILTSFAMERTRSAIANFEIKELLLRRKMLADEDSQVDLGVLGLVFTGNEELSSHVCCDTGLLDATSKLPFIADVPEEPPPYDTVTIAGFRKYTEWQEREATRARWRHVGYLNSLRCIRRPVYGFELLRHVRKMHYQVVPLEEAELNRRYSLKKLDRVHAAVQSYKQRVDVMAKYVDQFAFATPAAVALDLPSIALPGLKVEEHPELLDPTFDTLHAASVKLQIAFPEARLLQYDCGKLQELDILLRERMAGGHRVLIFTQMTRVLDILEIFLNLHGYRYLRLDGATKVEQRQIITERFNADARVFAFIASSRSGGVGINLTGADTVIFYDSDFNPAMDRQCEDRAHRIGQTRDVHIYRFITKHTIEENMLLTANHKRALDDVVIRQGDFDWRKILVDDLQMEQALAEVEDQADAEAARVALNEEKEDVADFEDRVIGGQRSVRAEDLGATEVDEEDEDEEVGGTTVDYMVASVERDWEYFGTL